MRDFTAYNYNMADRLREQWLDPDYNFFGSGSTNVDYETEMLDYYELCEEEIQKIKAEWEVEDLKELDKYEWSDILEELVGRFISSDKIQKIDLEENIITYYIN